MEASNSEGTVTGTSRNRETDAARLAHALALEAQVRGVDGQIREQLTTATSGTRSASLDSRVSKSVAHAVMHCSMHPYGLDRAAEPSLGAKVHQADQQCSTTAGYVPL